LFNRADENTFELLEDESPHNAFSARAFSANSKAFAMKKSDCFIGPEGGMLWLAGCLGVRTIYFTEHFHHVHPQHPQGDPWKSLGIVNMFPNANHIPLPSYCSNQDAVEIISNALLG